MLLCLFLIGCKKKQVNEKPNNMFSDSKDNLESEKSLVETNQEQKENEDEKAQDVEIDVSQTKYLFNDLLNDNGYIIDNIFSITYQVRTYSSNLYIYSSQEEIASYINRMNMLFISCERNAFFELYDYNEISCAIINFKNLPPITIFNKDERTYLIQVYDKYYLSLDDVE